MREEKDSHLDYFQNSVNLVLNSKAFNDGFKKQFFENLYVFLTFRTEKENTLRLATPINHRLKAVTCWLYHHKKPVVDAYQLLKLTLPDIYHEALDQLRSSDLKLKLAPDLLSLQQYINSIPSYISENDSNLKQFKALMTALEDNQTRCDALLTMFSQISTNKWPVLFVLFRSQITLGNFPSKLKIKDGMPEKLKAFVSSQQTYKTWLDVTPQLSNILQTTLNVVASSYNGYLSQTGNHALNTIRVIFYEVNLHIDNYALTILKTIFENDNVKLLPLLLQLKPAAHPSPYDYDYLSLSDETIASMLPESSESRTEILAKYCIEYCVRVNDFLFKAPYVKNNDEQALLIKKLYKAHQNKPLHIFLNLFGSENRDMVVKHLFSINKSFMAEKFLLGIRDAFTPYDDDDEILGVIIDLTMDLKTQGFNAKNLINTLTVKDKIMALIETLDLWVCFVNNFSLLFELHELPHNLGYRN